MSITEIIEGSGLTRDEVCRRAGISRGMLSMIETGARRAGPEKAVALAAALGVTPAEIRPDLAMFLSSSDKQAGVA